MTSHETHSTETHSTEAGTQAAGALPDFIIIGAMKCGTTSLHQYLSYHPDIHMSQRKEINFFVPHMEWSRGIDWYKSHFSEAHKTVGESSPRYTRYPLIPGVPERMHEVLPQAKLIYCVRDPIKRLVSHYVHVYSLGLEDRPFAEAVLAENNEYLLSSLYHYQLERYLKHYSASQIKVVVLEEMSRDPLGTLRDVFTFLGVDPTYQDDRFTKPSRKMPPAATRRRSPLKTFMVRRHLRGHYWIERNLPWLFGPPLKPPVVDEATRQELVRRLREDTRALRAFTGKALDSWSI